MNLILLFLLAFICELIDTSIGGGYGTILVPLSMGLGIDSLIMIPAVLFSEICTGLLGGYFHYRFKNVDLKIVGLDTILGFVGISIGVLTCISISKSLLNAWIGGIVLICGVLLFLSFKKLFIIKGEFKLKNDIPLTVLCSFNKGLSGGGYGPISTAGLIIIKADPKKSVGSTILSEGIVCIIGYLIFMFFGKASISLNPLTLAITSGACLATLPGAYITKKIDSHILKYIIAFFMIFLGIYTLGKVY